MQELIDSNSLQRELVRRYPLTHPDATEAEQGGVRRMGDRDGRQGRRGRRASCTSRGVVFCDLHPDNILLDVNGNGWC